RSAMASVEPEMHAKRLSVEADLGPAAEVTCSPRMTRVLQNLLMNAVRHTPTDGAVRGSARRNGQLPEGALQDSGGGSAPRGPDRGLGFGRFYRGGPARSGPGAGLGLALAKRIVEALGGRISAENALTHGARFAVVLPLT